MRRFLAAIAGAIVLYSNPALAEIVVGVNLPLSGPAAGLGLSVQRGLEFAPKEIGGEPVRYIVLDDGSDPSAAVRNVRKLATESNVDVIVGPGSAPAGYATAPVVTEPMVPMISVTPIELKGEKARWFANVLGNNEAWAGAVIADMKRKGVKRVAYIGYSDTWGDIVYDNITRLAAKERIEIISDERYARSDTSVSGQILKMIAMDPDAVMVGASASPAALPNTSLIERNFTKPIYNTDAVIGPDFLRLLGDVPDNVLAASYLALALPMLPDDNPVKIEGLPVVAAFEAKFGAGSLDGQASGGIDAGIILRDIATRALATTKPSTQEFRNALRSELYNTKNLIGTRGIYNFSEGNPYGLDERSIIMLRISDGKWVLAN
ncbi:ABC transporter substrate-binding protein [Rhizobium sp. AN83]|uniref:ABC transporter substrate-binding protein n=2 Tax=Rhizobium TaxID=379 RepID=UPI002B25F7CA|nr:ABC transporter substrate-binding protein [Rhizobium sp. AN83]